MFYNWPLVKLMTNFHKILLLKLVWISLEMNIVTWTENWLPGWRNMPRRLWRGWVFIIFNTPRLSYFFQGPLLVSSSRSLQDYWGHNTIHSAVTNPYALLSHIPLTHPTSRYWTSEMLSWLYLYTTPHSPYLPSPGRTQTHINLNS